MVLYRFLFAPVLLALAVLTGAGAGAHAGPASTRRAERPSALVVRGRAPAPSALPPGTGRAAAPQVPNVR